MNCAQIDKQLSAYLDGELTPPETEEVRRHLASCDSCRAAFEQIQSAVQAVKDLPDVPAPKDFHAGVMAKIESLPEKSAEKSIRAEHASRWRMLWPAAAAVFIAVFLALFNKRPEPPQMAHYDKSPSVPMTESEARDNQIVALTTPRKDKAGNAGDYAFAPLPSASVPQVEAARPELLKMDARPAEGSIALDKEGESDLPSVALGNENPADETVAVGNLMGYTVTDSVLKDNKDAGQADTKELLTTVIAQDGSQVWTVSAENPVVSMARLNTVATERGWTAPAENQARMVRSVRGSAPNILLNIPVDQLPILTEVVESLAEPMRGATALEEDAQAERSRREVMAESIPEENLALRKAEEPYAVADHVDAQPQTTERAKGAETAPMVKVTVFFQSPDVRDIPTAADALRVPAKIAPVEK